MQWVSRFVASTCAAGVLGVLGVLGAGPAPAATGGSPPPEASAASAVATRAATDVVAEHGDQSRRVRVIQARLRQIGWFAGDVTGYFGDRTRAAVRGFQAKRGVAVTGVVDRRTWRLLKQMTSAPTKAELANGRVRPSAENLDDRCTAGRVLCVDKTTRSLRWVVDGVVKVTVAARFGGPSTPTREGSFEVYRKSRDHVSSLYGSPMPFAVFFSGGQAVHYSPDFAANGYAGASHGCVNVRNRAAVAALFDRVRLGDEVVVYRS
ncbi:L,D-transpeptidase family protein [Nocardioides sp. SYSU DS0663]|uniref:L,D-transpeptidase family protein n=1 Tax=Nocardioides sp. SYSU DS0663 TaxID=3416445 RepID=UPI003F4B2978